MCVVLVLNRRHHARGMDSCFCCVCVPQASVGVLEDMGKFDDILPPGFATINPCTQSIAGVVNLRHQIMTCVVSSRTEEKTVVEIHVEIMYKVIPASVHVAFYTMSDPKAQVNSFVENSMRAEVPKYTMDKLFAMKREIADAAKTDLAELLAQYGYEVVDLLITNVLPARDVLMAMQRSVEARYERMVARTKGEIVRLEQVADAEAQAEVTRLSGVGMAAMRSAMMGGLGAAAQTLGDEGLEMTTEQKAEVMAMILMQQYLNSLDAIGDEDGNHVIFTSQTAASAGGLLEVKQAGKGGKTLVKPPQVPAFVQSAVAAAAAPAAAHPARTKKPAAPPTAPPPPAVPPPPPTVPPVAKAGSDLLDPDL